MDWSSIYEEHGEEEGDWGGWISRLDPILEKFALNGKYGPAVCYALTVNYILGVGCLGVPFAFFKSGIILGTIVIILLTLITLISALWVAEAGYRAIQIRLDKARPQTSAFLPNSSSVQSSVIPTLRSSENDEMKQGPKTNYMSLSNINIENIKQIEAKLVMREISPGKRLNHQDSFASIDSGHGYIHEETEVTNLVKEFLGKYMHSFFQLSLMMFTFIGLLAYSQVFNNSFISQIWPNSSYYVPIILFSIIVIPLSCMELSEQIQIQVIMSILRFISLGILLFGSIFALFFDLKDSQMGSNIDVIYDDSTSILFPSRPPYISNNIKYIDFSGFSIIFTTTIFSQLFQHSVPGLIRPLAIYHKKAVPTIFGGALLTTGSIYVISGIISALYFGSNTNQSINLNFVDFTWGISSEKYPLFSNILYIFSMIIVLFPAIDTLSIFPLIANTLGNNLNVFFPNFHKIFKRKPLQFLHYNLHIKTPKHTALIFWRLFAAIPPIILSAFISDLSLSLELAGICGIFIALVIPALLQRYSLFKISEYNNELAKLKTPYSTFTSSLIFTYVVIFIALVALVICTMQLCKRFL
eukprot:gene7221-14724_t